MKHANLSVFIPHAGCLHRCVFCDQSAVTGVGRPPEPEEVKALLETHLPPPGGGASTEIAFFGGSFTAIDRRYMTALLETAVPFVRNGRASGVRVSTRPDAVDPARLSILRDYGVTAVELGAQSADDRVLCLNRRGHGFGETVRAAGLIREWGISLGLQMMVGLYGERDAAESAEKTAAAFIALSPDTARIYPAAVLRGTALERLYRAGKYRPLPLEQALEITGKLLLAFSAGGVRVIRAGLHADAALRESVAAGPFHPAFGEMAQTRAFRGKLLPALRRLGQGGYAVAVAPGKVGAMIGQRRENLLFFERLGYRLSVTGDGALDGYAIRVTDGCGGKRGLYPV